MLRELKHQDHNSKQGEFLFVLNQLFYRLDTYFTKHKTSMKHSFSSPGLKTNDIGLQRGFTNDEERIKEPSDITDAKDSSLK